MPTNDDAWPAGPLTISDRNRDRRVPFSSRIATEDRTTNPGLQFQDFESGTDFYVAPEPALQRQPRANTSIWSPWPYTYMTDDQPVFPRGEEGPLGPQS